jgi:Na+-driven multidrug efflux pump
MATAVVTVTGAAFGGRDYPKLNLGYLYAIRIGVLIELVMAGITYFLAPQIAALFTLSPESLRIRADLIDFLRVICIFYPAVSPGMLSSAMFQGIGKGTHSLVLTVTRTILLTTPLAYGMAVVLDLQLTGLWWGIVFGNSVGAVISFLWGRYYVRMLMSIHPIRISDNPTARAAVPRGAGR